VVQPALGVLAEPSTVAIEVVPTRPAPPMEAIPVSSRDKAEASDTTSGVASPIVSDLLRTVLDTPEATSSSGTGVTEEVDPSEPLKGSFKVYIIQPPLLGGSGDLVRVALDPLLWGGPTLMWMSTEGNSYFVLDDAEERDMWAELRALIQVRALLSYVRNPLLFAV
jgi:hypothetical protein